MASSENKNKSQAVSSGFLLDLAGELKTEWLDLARYLNLSHSCLRNIREDNTGHTKEAKHQMLMCWKEANGQEATHSSLAEALVKARREDLSEKVKHEEGQAKKRSVENISSPEPAASSSKRQRTMEKPFGHQSAVGDEQLKASMKKKKAQFVKELRKKYRNLCGGIQPVPFLRDKYDIDELFIQSGMKFLEEKQRLGNEQEKWRGLKNYKMVFTDPRIKSKRRIIDGEPGYGKSTLCLQITHDWYLESSPMNDVEILILLRLRQLKNVPTVYSAIKKFLLPKDSKVTEENIKDILDSSLTLILLDGYDEYPDRGKENDIECIIREDMGQEYEVILTTRTSCLPPDYSPDTKRIRLTGFDDGARDAYIRNVVAVGRLEDANRINQFLTENPVVDDLYESPLFFAMISCMVQKQERFFNLKTATEFFRHIIKCFCTHKQTEVARQKELDHSSLDKITFEGLCGDSQQISWVKNELRSKIGKKLYNEYVRVGLLVEEEGYDYDAMQYNTETRFYHKLFVEWFAAHYLVREAVRQGAEFGPWHDSLLDDPNKATSTSQCLASAGNKVQLLKSPGPRGVYYMYRFACGLNHEAGLKIVEHLAKNETYEQYTLLCITEWGGSLEEIVDPVTALCSRDIHISDNDSVLLQKSAVKLIKFASDRKIPIDTVDVFNCLNVDSTGNLCLKPSNLSLPVIDTPVRVLSIFENVHHIMEDEIENILKYLAKCLGLKKLELYDCLLPQYIKVTESMSDLRSREVEVQWWSPDSELYLLNLESGQWEDAWDGTPMTDEGYQREVEEVRQTEEMRRQVEQEESATAAE